MAAVQECAGIPVEQFHAEVLCLAGVVMHDILPCHRHGGPTCKIEVTEDIERL